MTRWGIGALGLGLLLIPALGSYWFLTRFDGTRDRMARATGYQVVIRSAIAGLVLFGIARLVVAIADWARPQVGALWTRILPIADSGTSALSFVLGMAAAPVFNRLPCFDRGKAQRQLAEEEGNLIELLVQDAIDNRRYAELSLQSGKVYSGLPLKEPSRLTGSGGHRHDSHPQRLSRRTDAATGARERLQPGNI